MNDTHDRPETGQTTPDPRQHPAHRRPTTTAARISLHVTTHDADTAREAATRFADTINRVWIADQPASVDLVADGVYLVRVRVTAPTHELHTGAPIIQQGMYAAQHVAPADSLRIKAVAR